MEKLIFLIIIVFIALMGITNISLKGEIPQDITQISQDLKDKSKTKLELAKEVYMFINQSYTSPIRQYLKEPEKVIITSVNDAWGAKGGYAPSHIQNQMAKIMLLETGKFQESDFRIEQGWCEISPHSILFVRINESTEIAIDTWFADNGGMFNCYTKAPCGVEQKVCND